MSEMPTAGSAETADVTVLEMKNAHQLVLVAVTTVIGLVIGYFAPRVIGWALGIGGLPFEGPMHLLQRISDSWGSWVLIVIGGVLGVVVGLILLSGLVSAKVTARDIMIIKGSAKTRFARSQVALIVIDDGQLVLRDAQDADLIREKLEVPVAEVVATLRRYDWPVQP